MSASQSLSSAPAPLSQDPSVLFLTFPQTSSLSIQILPRSSALQSPHSPHLTFPAHRLSTSLLNHWSHSSAYCLHLGLTLVATLVLKLDTPLPYLSNQLPSGVSLHCMWSVGRLWFLTVVFPQHWIKTIDIQKQTGETEMIRSQTHTFVQKCCEIRIAIRMDKTEEWGCRVCVNTDRDGEQQGAH